MLKKFIPTTGVPSHAKRRAFAFLCTLAATLHLSCNPSSNQVERKPGTVDYAALEREASMEPIHPGISGKRPFWNGYSKRFIHAPAFDFKEIPEATRYRFTFTAHADSQKYSFHAPQPYVALTPIWDKLPFDRLFLKVEAEHPADKEKFLFVGEKKFIKSPAFSGVRTEPAFPYKESGYRNLRHLLQQPKVQYWLHHKRPDPSYPLWSHPSKLMSALTMGMIHYAQFFPDAADVEQASEIAVIVAKFLLDMAEPADKPLAFWPPTYWDGIPRGDHPYFPNEIMTNTPAIAAEMLLDLFEFTQDKSWFDAARRIADTYVQTQLPSGTWPQILHTETGAAVRKNKLVPTMVIELFDRFRDDYKLQDYAAPRQRAFDWCMQFPVRTFNWQAQFEDTRPQSQYKNLSREEPTEFARILFKDSKNHPEYIEIAEELIRFAEDQFVVWDPTDPVLRFPWFRVGTKFNGTGLEDGGSDWFVPCALEQYKFYTPIARSTQLMILAWLTAYEYTDKPVYQAKAIALANALTQAQAFHGGGEIPTHMRRHLPEKNWINNGVYPALTLIRNADRLSTSQMGH